MAKMTRWLFVYDGKSLGGQTIGSVSAWVAGRPTGASVEQVTQQIRADRKLSSVVITNIIELGDVYDTTAEANSWPSPGATTGRATATVTRTG